MVYLKQNFCFSTYTNSRTSAESIAAKRLNSPTKEKPEGDYYADLHEFKKRISSLKLPDDWQMSDKQNHIFQKSKSYEISSMDISYMLVRTWNLLFVYFPDVSH